MRGKQKFVFEDEGWQAHGPAPNILHPAYSIKGLVLVPAAMWVDLPRDGGMLAGLGAGRACCGVGCAIQCKRALARSAVHCCSLHCCSRVPAAAALPHPGEADACGSSPPAQHNMRHSAYKNRPVTGGAR